MRTLLCILVAMTSCTRAEVDPLAFFSTSAAKPLIWIEDMTTDHLSSTSKEAAKVIHRGVVARLCQRDHVLIKKESPQFCVKIELVKHAPTENPPFQLAMLIHLEILDLREENPKVILQEVLNSNALIQNPQDLKIDWSNPKFRMSPLGLAHSQLSREIASRIEDYVGLARKGTSS